MWKKNFEELTESLENIRFDLVAMAWKIKRQVRKIRNTMTPFWSPRPFRSSRTPTEGIEKKIVKDVKSILWTRSYPELSNIAGLVNQYRSKMNSPSEL